MSSAIAFFDGRTNDSGITGTVTFHPNHEMEIRLAGFEPHSTHAIHIHEYGDLTGGCDTLGSHFNPTGVQHGSDTHMHQGDHHHGDLMNNITADKYGAVQLRYHSPYLTPSMVAGRSVVLHYYEDDLGLKGILVQDPQAGGLPDIRYYREMNFKELSELCNERKYKIQGGRSTESMIQKLEEESLKTGNAGGRMACAVIGLSKSV
uniref:Superoxide dismutase copper/zinc binding domain-containing protein n=1 Tax=viral metagenome TaxID=1070528 RepID=A0A6C0K2A2_9ZZZZ